MGVNYLVIAAASASLSLAGLHFWTDFSFSKLQKHGLFSESFIRTEDANHALESVLDSYATAALVANFMFNVFILIILSLKTMFFEELHSSETRKVAERLINYIIYKGTFLPLVIPPTAFQAWLWSTWLIVICCLKMFQALARDRLERLNASPSATIWSYSRVFSVLLFVLIVDIIWIRVCLLIYRTLSSSIFLLLLFEPLSILFETMQGILVHGFQLFEIWVHSSIGNQPNCSSKFFDLSTTGSFSEWKGFLIRNLGFILDMATLLLALGHYLDIWWLHGMAFHLVDTVLFLNIRALLSATVKRVKGFIKLRMALGALHAALPDATSEEIRAYDDDCAICREPMAKAKRLHCNHLFHLVCLKSWLDQGLNDAYSCPTCRKPLLLGRHDVDTRIHTAEVLSDEQLARQINSGIDHQNPRDQTIPAGAFSSQMQHSLGGHWSGSDLDQNWLHSWQNQSIDGAGPSNAMRSVGLGGVQMMMRHLASVGETYAQSALEDSAWSLWPVSSAQASASSSTVPAAGARFPGNTNNLRTRTGLRTETNSLANIIAMAETVREVLPHIPDEIIIQDLQQTNSATVTVNNLLQM